MTTDYDGFSVEITGDSTEETVAIDSIKVDGVAYDIHFLQYIAPEFVSWCEDKILEDGTFADNAYFEDDETGTL
jgi:hypothetical protein